MGTRDKRLYATIYNLQYLLQLYCNTCIDLEKTTLTTKTKIAPTTTNTNTDKKEIEIEIGVNVDNDIDIDQEKPRKKKKILKSGIAFDTSIEKQLIKELYNHCYNSQGQGQSQGSSSSSCISTITTSEQKKEVNPNNPNSNSLPLPFHFYLLMRILFALESWLGLNQMVSFLGGGSSRGGDDGTPGFTKTNLNNRKSYNSNVGNIGSVYNCLTQILKERKYEIENENDDA